MMINILIIKLVEVLLGVSVIILGVMAFCTLDKIESLSDKGGNLELRDAMQNKAHVYTLVALILCVIFVITLSLDNRL